MGGWSRTAIDRFTLCMNLSMAKKSDRREEGGGPVPVSPDRRATTAPKWRTTARVMWGPALSVLKTRAAKAWGLLKPLPVPARAWTMLSMDYIVKLPLSLGFTTIFVVVDSLTKMAHFVPMKGTPTAAQTVEVFIWEIVRLHGLPKNIVSDRGVQFTSRFWRALCAPLDIWLALSSSYHSQTNGQRERMNQTLEQYLRHFSSFSQDNWSSVLLPADLVYNNSTHSATNQSPFMANYGYHPTFILDGNPGDVVPAAQDTIKFLQDNSQVIQEMHLCSQQRIKELFEKGRPGGPGSPSWTVSLVCHQEPETGVPLQEAWACFIGPFHIKRKINRVAYELQLPPSLRIHPIFHVAPLKPVTPNPFSG